MKVKYIFIALILKVSIGAAQELNIGDTMPDSSIELITSTNSRINTDQLKGKVILIDFWATWCSPCIEGMDHLDDLQNTFNGNLQVIAVSDEKRDRLERFAKNKPHDFLFGRDENRELSQLFPFRIIPHSVLINPKGKVVAITSPKNITHEVIRKIIAGEKVDLPLKKENASFDFSADYFEADPNTKESFVLQPYNPNIPSFSKQYKKGPFKGRRLTSHNTSITRMYLNAFQMNNLRLVLNLDESKVSRENKKNVYNLDLIVSENQKENLHRTLREKLNETFDIKARLEKKEMEVVVIYQIAPKSFAGKSVPERQGYSSRGDSFISKGATLDDFTKYLEGHGIFGKPVVNETQISGTYEIDFSYDPENADSFRKAFKELGLEYKMEVREIDVLVLYEDES